MGKASALRRQSVRDEEGSRHKLVLMPTSVGKDMSDRFDLLLWLVGRIRSQPPIMLVDGCDDRRRLHETGTRRQQ